MSLRLYAQKTLEMTAFTGCPIHKGDVGKHPEAPHPPRMQVGEVFVRFCVLKGFFFVADPCTEKKNQQPENRIYNEYL